MIKPLKQIFIQNENINNQHVFYKNQSKSNLQVECYESLINEVELCQLLDNNYDDCINNIVKEVTSYLSDESLCNDDENMFPQSKRLTGDWYVGDICISAYDENDDFEIDLSIMTRFTGRYVSNEGEEVVKDYLGLEVCFYFDKETEKFVLDGINSCSI